MNEEEAAAYYDDPLHAQSMCDLLMRTHPSWMVWRGNDRLWRARHETWPPDIRLASRKAGQINELIRLLELDLEVEGAPR